MDEFLKWALLNANHIPPAGIFLAEFLGVMIALYREWIVLGGPYRKCMTRVADFETKATQRAESNEAKTAQLEADFQAFKTASDATIARLEAENDVLREHGRRR